MIGRAVGGGPGGVPGGGPQGVHDPIWGENRNERGFYSMGGKLREKMGGTMMALNKNVMKRNSHGVRGVRRKLTHGEGRG